jgi:hypothetical protein
MRRKTPYVKKGEAFIGESQFIAGLPGEKLSLADVVGKTWDPRALVESEDKVDRYAAVKALGHVGREEDLGMLLSVATQEVDGRVALEAAAGAARLGSQEGFDRLMSTLREPPEPFLTMEAVLILTELGREAELRERCGACLRAVAGDDTYQDSEVRLASLWGLGKAGCRDYGYLAGLLGSDNFDEEVHLVSAFGSRLADDDIDTLVEVLLSAEASDRQKSSAAYVLMVADPSEYVVSRLADLMSSENQRASDWAAAVLGQMPRSCVEQCVGDETMLRRIRPAQLLSAEFNWTRDAAQSTRLDFVQRQDMF